MVRGNVDIDNATLITDEYSGYRKVKGFMPHETINHSVWYVDGDIHTNTIESFWAIVKLGRSKPKGKAQRVADGLPPFLNTRSIKPLLTNEIFEATVPVVFRTATGGIAHGYKAELLPKVSACYDYLEGFV